VEPLRRDCAGVEDVGEYVCVEQLVANPAVEGFNMGVLRRPAGLDEVQLDAMGGGPFQHQ
jgi:hypothetical protein